MRVRHASCLPWLGATLCCFLACQAKAMSVRDRLSHGVATDAVGTDETGAIAKSLDELASRISGQGILPRTDDPVPLLRLGGPEYPSKENPPLPKSKAGDKWFEIPMETRPLLRPGRTDSAARVKWPEVGWWQHKGTASSNRLNTATASSSSSSSPSRKSAWHRATKAVLQQGKKAGKLGKWFKKQNNRRDLQLHSRDVFTADGPSTELSDSRRILVRRQAFETGLLRRGQIPGKMRSAPSSSKPSWPTMFPMDHSGTDFGQKEELRKQRSFSLSPMRNGKPRRGELATPPPSLKGAPRKLSRAASEVGLKVATPKPQELKRAASSPSSTRAPWQSRKSRTPATPDFLHKGRPVWEDWGQYFKPLPQSARGGGDIKIVPKEVKQGKPTGRNPGGLSKLFADEQQP
ncbi:hypothetical protein BCV69DRAFT_158265 [Microstroma glucosiphilum]|uniref:Uncharacterized protein n=1 Tax=Pseudomicrostroma glucosiphilum TaxID=1684307 RepID=A0A316UAL4_9BASI|nr:hypothetical protein BCV69DRAFT_158265 [Pseudomicrostroma glucosiphilum]PWN21874.1 hypothetical protein BCV69DRAFT_158265 [Pseudomicrostroma glucosiphilum]